MRIDGKCSNDTTSLVRSVVERTVANCSVPVAYEAGLSWTWRGTAEKLGESSFPAVVVNFFSHIVRAVLLRQKSICHNQCYHARENEQWEKFSDLWRHGMALSL